MIITKATFDCTIAMPGYNNVKPGASEINLEPGETIEQAWTELNQRAMAWHKKEYPHCYQQPEILGPFHAKDFNHAVMDNRGISTISKDKERIEIAIDNCTGIDELLLLKDDAGKHDLLRDYMRKFVELENGSPCSFAEGLS